jgi:hypothetical protein
MSNETVSTPLTQQPRGTIHDLPENYDSLIGAIAEGSQRAITSLIENGGMLPSVELFARGQVDTLKQFAIINRVSILEVQALLGRMIELTATADGAARLAAGYEDEQVVAYVQDITPDIVQVVAEMEGIPLR